MNYSDLLSANYWRELLSTDFNRGYATGIALVLGVMILLCVLKIIWRLMFRVRRCGAVEVRCDGGDLVISRSAVENAARQVLAAFPQLDVDRIQLFRKGQRYRLRLHCAFATDGGGLPEIASKVKPKMTETLHRVFGIDTLDQITLQIDTLESTVEAIHTAAPEPQPAVVAEVGNGTDSRF